MTNNDPDEVFDAALAGRLDYHGYLALEPLLSSQRPVSETHDEMLFIVIHQTSELWLKLALHELRAARSGIAADNLGQSFKTLARVSRIQAQLIQSWDVLSTLTPSEYLVFRDRLGPASGFQSHQYRLFEFMLGNRSQTKLDVFAHQPGIAEELHRELAIPSLYDEALRLLKRREFEIPASVLGRDFAKPYRPSDEVLACWLQVYRDTEAHWDLYELAEKLVDLEDWFRQWRFRHLATVERIIGRRTGTGGTSGVGYLRRALDIELFPELWRLRTEL